MVRYTLLRILIFFGCLAALWLAGLRDQGTQQVMLVGFSAIASMILSFFVLKPFREDYSRQLAAKINARQEARVTPQPRAGSDEDVEDGEYR